MTQIIESLLGGMSIGSVLLLSALGLAIVFGLMGVINMAHGELMMIGAYTTFVVQNVFKETPLADFYIFFAIIIAFLLLILQGISEAIKNWNLYQQASISGENNS